MSPISPYGPYGPPSGPPGPHPHHSMPPNYRPPQMQHQYPPEPRRSSYPDPIQRYPSRQASPRRWSQQTSFQPANQHRDQPSQWTAYSHDRGPMANPVVASVSPGVNADTHETHDEDPNDLRSLDFATEEVYGEPPVRLARPLLADPAAADAFGPLLAVLSEGKYSVSKYFTNENVAEMERSIKDTPYWPEFKDDPVFREIGNSGNVVPSSELQHSDIPNDPLEREDQDRKSGNGTRNSGLPQKESNQEVENAHFLDNADQGYLSRTFTSSSSEIRPASERDSTEEILARLGVTGAPKPVVKTALVSRPDRPVQHHSASSGNGHPGRNDQSPNPGQSRESVNGIQLLWPARDNGTSSDDLTSQTSPEGNHHASSDVASNTNGHSDRKRSASPQVHEEESKTKHTSDYREKRKESKVNKGEPRRQIDDVTPRFKKRQPKVAEAYR
ncbi:MAG: hypothetical protein M1816_003588 [Peltula sp. TS41687]|nr:MAG: hypothetical protein M1816_003588 [Peltula sp. TS41687]